MPTLFNPLDEVQQDPSKPGFDFKKASAAAVTLSAQRPAETKRQLNFSGFIQEIKKEDFKGTNFVEYKDGGGEIYISFKTLLRFLDTYTNLESKGKTILKIDWESDKPFLAYSTTVSCNLQKCYIFNSYLGTTDGNFGIDNEVAPFEEFKTFEEGRKLATLNDTLRQAAGKPSKYSIYPVIGNINNIYLNAGFLSQELTKGSDNSESKVSIRAFLQTICDGVNKALGGVNDFQVVVDADENQATIVDFNQKRIKGLSAINGSNITTIKAQGLGSFLTGISAQSSITPDMATMISIGAQAGGNALGEEATSFSRLSRGITDRVYPEKIITNSKNKTPDKGDPGDFEKTIEAYKQIIANQKSQGESQQAISFKSDSNTNLENIAVDLYKGCLGTFTKTDQTSTTFIPVKLDFTLAGISGIKIFQRFTISGDVLPYTYKDNFDFIVTGVSHDISNDNIWHTKIASIIALKDPKEEPDKLLIGTYIEIGDITTGDTSTQSASNFSKGSVATTTAETVSFLTDVLIGLGIANPNQYQIQFMKAWRQHEGGKAAWNPFNSTINKPGATIFNSATVKNYPDRATGLAATLGTLNLNYYKEVVKVIKNIKIEKDINKAMQTVNDSPWGSNFNPPLAGNWRSLTNLIYKDPIVSKA